MAYAEKRGKGPRAWRVKYKRPDGSEACRSGFETKAAALTWGCDEEARIREGRWIDPKDSQITVSEWVTRWQRLQDVGPSTTANREYLLRRFIQPDWGSWPLSSLSTEEITGNSACRPGPACPAGPPGCAQPAVHDPWRRCGNTTAADPL